MKGRVFCGRRVGNGVDSSVLIPVPVGGEEIVSVIDHELNLSKQIERLTTMLEISRILSSTLDLGRLELIIVESATRIVECEDSSILLIDPHSGELVFEASARLLPEQTKPVVVPIDSSIAGWVVRNDRPVILADATSDPRYFARADQETGFHTHSLLGVPVSFKGRVIGVLMAVNKIAGEFTDRDTELLTVLAAQAAVAIENARLLAELQRAYQELNELDRLKSEFITTTSHELRTPLTAIKGYLQLVNRGMFPPDRQAEVLQTVAQHVDTVVYLVNDLLLMQEMQALDLHETDVDLGTIANLEMQACRERAKAAGIRWVAEIASGVPPVRGDAERLQRMLHNLLDNAIKFSPDGGDVTVRVYAADGHVHLQVSDPGIGIPQEKQARIFERFYRIEQTDRHLFGGLGLGLSIARQIAQEHGGQIDLVSAPGQGSTFTVKLPARAG